MWRASPIFASGRSLRSGRERRSTCQIGAAVRDHFAGAIVAYRVIGVVAWTQVEIDARQLGEYSAFATVHWNAVAADREVLRDTWTSYHLLDTPNGWLFLSYTNHF